MFPQDIRPTPCQCHPFHNCVPPGLVGCKTLKIQKVAKKKIESGNLGNDHPTVTLKAKAGNLRV